MTPPLVLFHAGCPDGFCAAWVFLQKHPFAEIMAVGYGDPPPAVTGRDVWILDFSYKRGVTLALKRQVNSLHVFDHHETSQYELEGIPEARIEMGKSGARLIYDELFGEEKAPWRWIVDYTEDRDLWLNKLPQTREISAAIASFPRTTQAWNEMVAQGYGPLITEGEAILRYKTQIVSQVVSGAKEMNLDGHFVMVANCGVGNLESEVAGALAEGRPFGACWSESGNKRKWSLRSDTSGLNVARIAERRGGGG